MITFDVKKIKENSTLGELLHARREALGLSLVEIEQYTKVSQEYLRLLEAGNYKKLPADVYVRNFIKAYSRVLELDPYDLIERYEMERDLYYNKKNLCAKKKRPSVLREKTLRLYDFLIISRVIKGVGIALLLSIFFGYIGYSVQKMNEPPMLVVDNPDNNSIIEKAAITVAGHTTSGVEVLINGVPVLLNDESGFERSMHLNPGVNVIHIMARNKHGRETSIHRQVLVDVPGDNDLTFDNK